MKPAARNVLILIVLAVVLAGAVAEPPRSASRALFAWGTSESLWSADVNADVSPDVPAGVLTTVRVRKAGDELHWGDVGELSEVPVSISNRGSELLIVLDDGEWKIVSEREVRSGLALPDNGRVMALAGAGDDIWAIGGLDLTRNATTNGMVNAATNSTSGGATIPSSKPIATPTFSAVATTRDSSKPPRPMALFVMQSGKWKLVDEVPLEYKPEQIAAVSLAMLDDVLTLAIVGPDRAIRLYTRTQEHWSKPIDVGGLNEEAQIKLLDVHGRPALWVADANSAGELYFASEGWKHPVKLAPSAKLAGFDRRSLAYSLGQLRLLATDGKGHLAEQLYDDANGKLQGEPREAVTGPSDSDKRVGQIIRFIILAAFVAWMLGSLRQRPNLAEAIRRIDSLHVAPMGSRLAGGVIDLIPLLAGCVMGLYFSHLKAGDGHLDLASPEVASFCAGLAVYLLHVTLTEVLTGGRSLGKWITGTRVVTLTGTTPAISQLLARNALRIIDIAIAGIPLLSILQSPLRQRVGDMMVGTIVSVAEPLVMDNRKKEDDSSKQ